MNVSKTNQQPNFKGQLTVTKYVKNEAGKIVGEAKKLVTTTKNDASVRELCNEIRNSLKLDTTSYRYLNLHEEAARKLTGLFQTITGEKLPENGLIKKLIDTPKGAVANRDSDFIEFGDIMANNNGGITYQLNFKA